MKCETLAELVARTIIEFEKREAQLQKQASQLQPRLGKPHQKKSKVA